MEDEEPEKVAEFLAAQHTDRPRASSAPTKRSAYGQNHKRPRNRAAETGRSANAACKHCGSKDLTARSGQYGYYWKCGACDKNTAMPAVCSALRSQKGARQPSANPQDQELLLLRLSSVRNNRANLG